MSLLRQARDLRKDSSPSEAAEFLVDAVRRGLPTPPELEAVGRRLTKDLKEGHLVADGPRVLLLGQITTDWLRSALLATCWGRGLHATVRDADYDQVMQELAGMSAGDVDVVVLLPWHSRLLAATVADEVELWSMASARVRELGASLVFVGHDVTGPGPSGAHMSSAAGPVATVREANAALRQAIPEAYYVDLEFVAGSMGRDTFYDARQYFWTKQPFSSAGVALLAHHLAAGIRAVTTGPRKVLVLDCDNTLWGGVVGELGALGIALGDSPEGEAYRAFQGHCKGLASRGVLLAVSTKNNPDDAREPFERNPDMVLGLDDLSAFEANWKPKSLALQRMAAELRLGLDSFVFFDDNPAEREQIRLALPEVEVVEVPTDPAGYIAALEHGLYFETIAVTDADRERGAQYRAELVRTEAKASFTDVGAWLDSLKMVGDIRRLDAADLQRTVQLIGKTNQFNLTTRRHPQARVQALIDDERSLGLTLRVADRFGDHGLVSVVLGLPHDEHTLRLDTWLMSCRVIGRTAEQFMLRGVAAHASALGYSRLIGEYVPTAKNSQVADLFERLGFTPIDAPAGADPGLTWHALDLDTAELPETRVGP